jgi:uncharacterized protein
VASAEVVRLPCPNRECHLLSLDPNAPLVLDTRELVRRPGSQRKVSRTVPAPPELGTVVLGVPEGEPVQLELRVESVMEGVLVTGTARTRAVGECARCLQDIELDVDVDLQELYVYPESEAEDDEAGRVVDDRIDLDPLLRDAVVLALPFRPLCRDDCPGLCPRCGARLADDPGHGHEEPDDPRWAALAGWTHEDRPGTPPGPDEE